MTSSSRLSRCRPEEQGVQPKAILDFVKDVNNHMTPHQELHSFMLMRHGYVIAEGWWAPHKPELPHMLFSLSKSFTSTAVGMAVDEGRLSVDDFVVSFFPDKLPTEASENLKQMKVKHLLSMSTGHSQDVSDYINGDPDGDWVKGFLSAPVEHAPGTHFVYNTPATYMLSAIVYKLTGLTLMEYLQPRLFGPLGIEGAVWESCPRGINVGGYGLSVKTEDIAKFAQLYLQKGNWNGKQLVSERWIAEATSKQVENGPNPNSDWNQGYGYQFWRCQHGLYRGDGAFGQYAIIFPEHDAALAITSAAADMQVILDMIYKHILPGLSSSPVTNDDDALVALSQELERLELLPESSCRPQSGLESYTGDYAMEDNPLGISKIKFDFNGDDTFITVESTQSNMHARCKQDSWTEHENGVFGQHGKLAVKGVWAADSEYVLVIRFVETPFYETYRVKFNGNSVSVDVRRNISFGPLETQTLVGQRQAS